MLALAVLSGGPATDAEAQSPDQPARDSFRVSWQHRVTSIGHAVVGSVSNGSAVRVTSVRLRIEGLSATGESLGVAFVWALGDIVPAGETSFIADSIPGAAEYRITVESFDLVSVNRAL